MEKLPEEFVKRMKDQLGGEAEDFFYTLSQPSPTSIRLNHFKGRSSFQNLSHIPWCENGYYLPERPRFHLDPHWHGGAYYVQEASSMILDEVIKHLMLDPRPRIWLDMCAAPGGKTGILAKHLNPTDVLIANEVVPQRKSILRENLIKGGYVNTMILGEQPSSFLEPLADIILIDAPCAGEGMMRKEPEAILQWSPGLVTSCSLLQKQIVNNAMKALKPDGFLIYSTCSYSMQENILNVSHFIDQFGLESIPFTFPVSWGIMEMGHQQAIGYQMYPHRVNGEGLFIAVLKNHSNDHATTGGLKRQSNAFISTPAPLQSVLNNPLDWKVRKDKDNYLLIRSEAVQKANEVLRIFPRAEIIADAGQLKGKDFIPSHFLAMSGIQDSSTARIDLDLNEALNYLERSTSIPSSETKNGWYLPGFETTTLGWIKHTNQGWKNHYPLNWRLRTR